MPHSSSSSYLTLPRYDDTLPRYSTSPPSVRSSHVPTVRTPLLPKPISNYTAPASTVNVPKEPSIFSNLLPFIITLHLHLIRAISAITFLSLPVSVYLLLVPGTSLFALYPIALIGALADKYLRQPPTSYRYRSNGFSEKLKAAAGDALEYCVTAILVMVLLLLARLLVYCALAIDWEVRPVIIRVGTAIEGAVKAVAQVVWAVLKAVAQALWVVLKALWRYLVMFIWNLVVHPGDVFEKLMGWKKWKF